MKKYLISLILIISITSAFSQTKKAQIISNDSVRKYVYLGFRQINNLEFRHADTTFSFLQKKHPKSPWTYVMGANLFWWKFMMGDDSEYILNKFYTYLKKIDNLVGEDVDNESKFCRILVFSLEARMDLWNEKYIKVLGNLNDYISLISSTFGQEDLYQGFLLTNGLYHFFMGLANEKYPLMRPILALFPAGQKEYGLKLLSKINQDDILINERNYFLSACYLEWEYDFPKAEKYAKQLIDIYPDNIDYHITYEMSIARKEKRDAYSSTISRLISKINRNSHLSNKQKEFLKAKVYRRLREELKIDE